ncbi:MAG: prolipoprotein diacylglyceryl transferase [Oscillospiraceae bacterium]|nr:prolipoprotein diacylglyceryl transferase [Oscillospiraceae bacterium]
MSSASISFPFLGDWSINPSNSFVLFGHTFYWYGVIIACGFLLAVVYCFHRCREFGISQDDLTDNLLFAVPIAIIGARIYYVLFNLENYHSFWDACKIWEGGLAIYGGVIAAVITVLIVCRVKKISSRAVLDTVSFGLLIGQSIGRWGNFMNREAYGYETDIFCRMGLTLNGETIYVHPTFLYESLWNAVGFVLLHILSKKTKRRFDGQYFLYYLAWYGLGRSWIEGLRTDSLYIGGTGIRVSQLLAILTFLAAVFILVVVRRSGLCKPENLWVNKVAMAAAVEAETPAEAAGTEKPEEPAAPKSNVIQEMEDCVFGELEEDETPAGEDKGEEP